MKVSKKDRNKHIAWTLKKYADGPQKHVASMRQNLEAASVAAMDCSDAEQFVKMVPALNRMEENIERHLGSQSLIGQLDALRACLPA